MYKLSIVANTFNSSTWGKGRWIKAILGYSMNIGQLGLYRDPDWKNKNTQIVRKQWPNQPEDEEMVR